MRWFDADDRKALGQIAGVVMVGLVSLAVVAVAGAGIVGLAIRVFELGLG